MSKPRLTPENFSKLRNLFVCLATAMHSRWCSRFVTLLSPPVSKQMRDEDAVDLLRIQEKLLEDGDLHMEGERKRKTFRWRHDDEDDVWIDHFADSSDDENDANQFEDQGVKIIYKEQVVNDESTTETATDGVDGNDAVTAALTKRSANAGTMPAFSGPQSSIRSFLVNDRRTFELLSKKSISPRNALKRPIKKLKMTAKPVKSKKAKPTSAENGNAANSNGPNLLELLSRFE